jgi:pseudouridine-5'-monophosphatase
MSHRTPSPAAAIFDLDGTLLDTEPFYTQAAQAVVERFGKVFDWELKREVMGGGPLAGAAIVVERLGLPISAEQYLAEREAILLTLFAASRPLAGVEALVEALHGRGLPLAIGTSSSRKLCALKLSAQSFARRFDVIVCSDDPEVRNAKPAPDIFLAAAARLGAAPQRCLVFEDTPKGVQAALAAGMRVVAVPDARMPREDFAGALRVYGSLAEVELADLGL